MKSKFAITSNVKAFCDLAELVCSKRGAVPGMGFVYGKPGLGKTETAVWYHASGTGYDSVYLRAKAAWSVNWFLTDLVVELGEEPARRSSDMFDQVIRQLQQHERLIIIDEIDHCASDRRVLETIRDLHDVTTAPVIMIGMSDARRKLKRFVHLYSRFLGVVEFKDLGLADITAVIKQLCEIRLEEKAVKALYKKVRGELRELVIQLFALEHAARESEVDVITEAMVRS